MHTRSFLPPVARFLLGLLTLALPLTLVMPARAATAPPKLFVSVHGNDSNAGGPLDPKRTLQAAHDAVAASGEIVVLDTAGYGTLNITKGLTVTCPPGVNGFITTTGSENGVVINAATTDTVILRGLVIEGVSQTAGYAIYSTQMKNLRLDDVKIRNFLYGVYVYSKVFLSRLTLERCSIEDVKYGVSYDGSSVGIAWATMTDSSINNAAYACVFTGDGTNVIVRHCVFNDCTQAVFSLPDYALVQLGSSTLSGDYETKDTSVTNSGSVYSYGDNLLYGLAAANSINVTTGNSYR